MILSGLLVPIGLLAGLVASVTPAIETHVDVVDLVVPYDRTIAAYYTYTKRHRRLPFACATSACYLAWLDTTKSRNVYVQQLDPKTFKNVGAAVKIGGGQEAGGLVAQEDGFALLTSFHVPGVQWPVAYIVRYKDGNVIWKTALNGPGIHPTLPAETSSPDLNGDLTYSEESGYYGAYFVVTAFTEKNEFHGHYGDSFMYVNAKTGKLLLDEHAPWNPWSCSHNTGIALAPSKTIPFMTICAQDSWGLILNTGHQNSMDGKKVAFEQVINGMSGDSMNGMSGSYSHIASFKDESSIFVWRSRGALNTRYTPSDPHIISADSRWLTGNVAITLFKNKFELAGKEAVAEIGIKVADSNHGYLTYTSSTEHHNVHVATVNEDYAVAYWDETAQPICKPLPDTCIGKTGSTRAVWQLLSRQGKPVGAPIKRMDGYVTGDMKQVNGKVCWPYINAPWSLDGVKEDGTVESTSKVSIGCFSLSGTSTPAINKPTSPAPKQVAPASPKTVPVHEPLQKATLPCVNGFGGAGCGHGADQNPIHPVASKPYPHIHPPCPSEGCKKQFSSTTPALEIKPTTKLTKEAAQPLVEVMPETHPEHEDEEDCEEIEIE